MDLENLLYIKNRYYDYLVYETEIEDYIKVADPNYRPKMVTNDYKALQWDDVKETVWDLNFKRDKSCYQIVNHLEKIEDPVISEYFIAEHSSNWEQIQKSSDNYKLYLLNEKLTDKYLNEPTKTEIKKRKI